MKLFKAKSLQGSRDTQIARVQRFAEMAANISKHKLTNLKEGIMKTLPFIRRLLLMLFLPMALMFSATPAWSDVDNPNPVKMIIDFSDGVPGDPALSQAGTPPHSGAVGIVLGPDRNFYVSSINFPDFGISSENVIYTVKPNGKQFSVFATLPSHPGPVPDPPLFQIANVAEGNFDGDGNLWIGYNASHMSAVDFSVTHTNASGLYHIDKAGTPTRIWPETGDDVTMGATRLQTLTGVAVIDNELADGNDKTVTVFLADCKTYKIHKITVNKSSSLLDPLAVVGYELFRGPLLPSGASHYGDIDADIGPADFDPPGTFTGPQTLTIDSDQAFMYTTTTTDGRVMRIDLSKGSNDQSGDVKLAQLFPFILEGSALSPKEDHIVVVVAGAPGPAYGNKILALPIDPSGPEINMGDPRIQVIVDDPIIQNNGGFLEAITYGPNPRGKKLFFTTINLGIVLGPGGQGAVMRVRDTYKKNLP